MVKKIGVLSLGCARNLVDSEVIGGRLKQKGYDLVNLSSGQNTLAAGVDKISTVLVNTCAFIKEAKEESIQTILDLIDLKKEGRVKRIIIAGCLSQRYKEKLIKELPEIDAFLGAISLNHGQGHFRFGPAYYAYVKICESCINDCSFCVIPKIKSRFISRKPKDIISQIKVLNNQGCREINLIGQDITAYGWDLYRKFRLTDLVKQIVRNSRKAAWLRLLYLSPERVSDELIELIASSPGIVKYIDLPLQHINNRILKLMRRNITRSEILRLIDKIRKKIPGVAIRSSFIVGFPSETDNEFKELLNFIQKTGFERLGLFMYSREEGTKAYGLSPQIPQRVKEKRYNIVMSSQRELARQINKKWQGRVLEVLVEEKPEDGLYIGRSQYDAPEVDGLVYIKTSKELSIGSFIDVKIIDTLEYDLVGEGVG